MTATAAAAAQGDVVGCGLRWASLDTRRGVVASGLAVEERDPRAEGPRSNAVLRALERVGGAQQ